MTQRTYQMEVTTTTRSVYAVTAASPREAASIAREASEIGGFRAEQKQQPVVQIREAPRS